MELNQFTQGLQDKLKNYAEYNRKSTTKICMDALAMIKARVIEKGENPEGGKYTGYSDNDLPAYYYTGKSRSEVEAGGAKNYLGGKSAAMASFGSRTSWSYKEWRDANNLQTDHKDFYFSGNMWKNIKVTVTELQDTFVILQVQPTDGTEKQKLEWNEERDGEILRLSDKEIEYIKEAHFNDVRQYFIQ